VRLGTIEVLEVRLAIPGVGAWVADCDLDLGSDQAVPTGRQTLIVGSSQLVGTIDKKATGRFGEKARARLVAGAGAWGDDVPAEHFHNDATGGITSEAVLTATASKVGETVVDASPVSYGTDFFRVAGPASGVLDGRAWYVDALGVTQVAQWPAKALGSDVDVLSFDPGLGCAELAGDDVIWPGTVIGDARFASFQVGDVEQVFTRSGSRAKVWSSSGLRATSRFADALERVVDRFAGGEWLKVYRYRIVTEGVDGRVRLQAVTKASGVPDTMPVSIWPGMSGLSATHAAGTEVAVVFLNGDKAQPRVIAFDGRVPLELVLDATGLVKVGGGATSPAAKGDVVDVNFAAAKTFASAVGTIVASCVGPSPSQQSAFASALTTFLAAVTATVASKARVE